MLLSELESLKSKLEKQTEKIVEGLRDELNIRNVGGDSFRATSVLEDIKTANQNFLSQLKDLSRGNHSTDEGRNSDSYFVLESHPDKDMMDGSENGGNEEMDGINVDCDPIVPIANDECGDVGTRVNDTKGIMIAWDNCRGGKILLTRPCFTFPSMTFPNMLTMCFCGDISKNIPPYRILRAKDVEHIKGGKQKLSNMKALVKQVIRAARMGNRLELIVKDWSPRKVLDLYTGVRHFFAFPCISNRKKRRDETISWKTYLNCLMKRKGKFIGEQ